MTDNLIGINKDRFTNFLQNERNANIPWIQRKEVSAWSALLFLFAILWALTSFSSNQNSFLGKIYPIPFSLMIYALCFVFFRFIHAQYASIYYMSAYTVVIRKIIFNMCEDGDSYLKSKEILNENFLTDLDNETEAKLNEEIQKFRGKCHPLRILIYFWTYPFILLFQKIFHKDKRPLTTFEKAEASIYSLIVLVAIFYTWYLYF